VSTTTITIFEGGLWRQSPHLEHIGEGAVVEAEGAVERFQLIRQRGVLLAHGAAREHLRHVIISIRIITIMKRSSTRVILPGRDLKAILVRLRVTTSTGLLVNLLAKAIMAEHAP
jgi:hypothetical protein